MKVSDFPKNLKKNNMAQTKLLVDKLKALEIAIRLRLACKIMDKGVESEHRSEKVLKVKDAQMFNIDGGRWLTEISTTELIDNNGYSYDFSILSIQQLCEAIDNA